jgi:hypothetical protein
LSATASGLLLSIERGPCRAFGNVTAITANEPLPFAADMQHGEITRAERRFLDGESRQGRVA